jgi:mRNA interferase MazF
MTVLQRGMIIDVNLDPTQGAEKGKIRPCVIVTNNVYNERVPVTEWSEKKNRIKTNVEILPSKRNGLSKQSIADCLQTRPIDYKFRMVKIRGELTAEEMKKINEALKIVFALQ